MTKIQGISDYASQLFTINLPNGETLQLSLTYMPLQTGWFMGVTYKDFVLNTMRVTTSQNLLHAFRKLLPFGIACITVGDREPFFAQDFQANNSALCILDEDELDALDVFLGS